MTGHIWVGAVSGALTAIALGAAACSSGPPQGARSLPFHAEKPAAPFISRQICSLLDENGNGAHIRGQDGGTTNVVDGTVYWTFGDTMTYDEGEGGLEPNNVATSQDFEAEDCITFDHKRASDGVAAALLEKQDGEITVWAAAGQVSVEPNSVHFLYNSVTDADNAAGYHDVQGIGLARFDRQTLNSERIIEFLITPDDLPGEALTLTPAVDMLENEGFVYVYFAVNWNVRVGRVSTDDIEDKTAYRYWDGAGWVPEPAAAIDILRTAGGQQAFNVRFNPYVGKWTAMYSTNTLSAAAIAYGDSPVGPFEHETLLFDCRETRPARRFDPVTGFLITIPLIFGNFRNSYFCYHVTQHPELDKDDRQTMYLTYGSLATYRLYLLKLVMALPFYQWQDESGHVAYGRAGGDIDGYEMQDVAFYAPTFPTEGLTPIHDWYDAGTGVHLYEPSPPGASYDDAGVAFYASTVAAPGLEPVYRWEREADVREVVYSTFDIEDRGFERGPVAFYAATLAEQTFFDPDDGYVYWIRVKGQSDFGCCGATNNPTRQSNDREAQFTLQTPPNEKGYEAIVCSPACGTEGEIVWSGDVEFEPNGIGGTLKLTPNGPK